MANLGDTANSMASLGLGPGLSAAPSQGLFSTSLGASLKGVNQTVTSLVKGLTQVANLMKSIEKSASTLNRSMGQGGARNIFNNGGLGNGGSMHLGTGSFSTPPAAASASMAGGGGAFGRVGGGFAAAAGAAGMLGGMAQVAMAPLAAAYGSVASFSDVAAQQRSMVYTNLLTGRRSQQNMIGINAATFGLGQSRYDMYGAANAMAFRGIDPTSAYGSGMLRNMGMMSRLMGVPAEQMAASYASVSPRSANYLKMMGVQSLNSDGTPKDLVNIANQIWDRTRPTGNQASIAREFTQPGSVGYRVLETYFPDPQQREVVRNALLARAANKGKKVTSLSDINRLTGGALDIEGAQGNVFSAERSMDTKFINSQTEAAVKGLELAEKATNVIKEMPGAELIADMRAGLEGFASTRTGDSAISAATMAVQGFTTALGGAVAMISGLVSMAGLGGVGGGLAGLASKGGGLLGKAGKVGGAGGLLRGAGRLLAGAGVAAGGHAGVGWLRDRFAGSPSVGQGTVAGDYGTIFGEMGSFAAGGATVAGPWGAAGGAAVGYGVGANQVAQDHGGWGQLWREAKTVGSAIGGSLVAGIRAFSGGDSQGAAAGERAKTSNKSGGATGQAIVNYALRFVGRPYLWGGTTPNGWDCSGFTGYVFRHFGISLPRVSRDQARTGRAISFGEAQPGDLLFFHSPVSHVAIYMGGGKMVHAANRKLGTITSTVWKGLTHVRRVVSNSGSGTANRGVGDSNSNAMSGGQSRTMGPLASALAATTLSQGVGGFSASIGSVMDILGAPNGAVALSAGASGEPGGDPGVPNSENGAGKNVKGGGSGVIADALRKAGFTDGLAKTMWAIAMAESSGNPKAHNPDASTGDNSYGLWQINMLGDMGPERRKLFGISSNSALLDPYVNARAAMAIYRQQGLNAWSTYRHGTHKKYLADAPGFSKGAWRIDGDQVANIHAGEMILPASIAHAVRTALQTDATGKSSGSPSGAGYGPVTIQVMLQNGSDSEVMRVGNKLKSVLSGEKSFETLRTT